ncbi:MAG: carboxypeptidase-like regulatory domain-containing protein [Bacteroidia bacterium]|nr:carboxypeptidase-like regulatory domain-containing protein [Bacteroidia bacterium]
MKHHLFTLLISFYLLILLVPNLTLAQVSFFKISGKIIDKETNEPIPYASIGIRGKTIGTVSNMNGNFHFTVPVNCLNDSLFVSCIGYASYSFAIKGDSKSTISLTRKNFRLKEVTVKPKWDDPKKIVKEAVKRIRDNAPEAPYLCNAYYREFIKEDSLYAKKVEAALTINDSGEQMPFWYFESIHKDIRVDELRKSKSYFKYPEINYGLELQYLFFTNGLTILKYYSDHRFSLDSICFFDNELVYSISYKSFWESSKFFISVADFAFVKVIRKEYPIRITRNLGKNERDSVFEITEDSSVVQYTKINQKWYPKYYYVNQINKFRRSKNLMSMPFVTSVDIVELLVNNIFPGKQINMSKKEKLEEFARISILIKDSHPEFWENYNVILPNPVEKQAEIDFEKQENRHDRQK